MADPAVAAGRSVGERTSEALEGVPETAVDRIESALLAEGQACRFTPSTCMDDMCRTSDVGLCGNADYDLYDDDDDYADWDCDAQDGTVVEVGAWLFGEPGPA